MGEIGKFGELQACAERQRHSPQQQLPTIVLRGGELPFHDLVVERGAERARVAEVGVVLQGGQPGAARGRAYLHAEMEPGGRQPSGEPGRAAHITTPG